MQIGEDTLPLSPVNPATPPIVNVVVATNVTGAAGEQLEEGEVGSLASQKLPNHLLKDLLLKLYENVQWILVPDFALHLLLKLRCKIVTWVVVMLFLVGKFAELKIAGVL